VNHKLSAAAMTAVVLVTASSLLGFPSWLKLALMIFAVLLVLANVIDIGKWVIRKNLDLWRRAKGVEKSEESNPNEGGKK
jgi:hypothetical protein